MLEEIKLTSSISFRVTTKLFKLLFVKLQNVFAYITNGTPIEIKSAFKVLLLKTFLLLFTPPPGIIEALLIWNEQPSLVSLDAHKLSIVITSVGFVSFTTELTIS